MASATEIIRIIADMQVKGANAFKGAADDVSKLESASKRAGGGISSGMGTAVAGFGKVAAAAGVAGIAIGAAALAAKKGWDVLAEGAALNRTAARFDKLSESIGTTSNVLTAQLRAATHGTISDMELMANASQLISLRLADNADQVVRLGAVAGTLNWDMRQVILTFANMSKMRLDALGLSVGDVTSKARELELQGMSSQEAFKEAVILAGEAQKALLDVGNDAVRSMEQAQAGFTNAMDGMKMGLAKAAEGIGLTGLIGDIGGALTSVFSSKEENQLRTAADAIAQANANIAEGNATNEQYLAFLERAASSGLLYADTQKLISSEIEKVNAAIEEQSKMAALAAAGGRQLSDIYTEWAVATKAVGEQAEAFLANFNASISSSMGSIDAGPLIVLGSEFEGAGVSAGNMTISVDAANVALYEAAQAAGASAGELALLGVATGMFTEAEADAALKTAILQETIKRLATDYAEGTISVYEMSAALREQMSIVAGMPSMFAAASQSAQHLSVLTSGGTGGSNRPWYSPSAPLIKRDVEEIEKAKSSFGGFTQQVDHLAAAHARMADAFSKEINFKMGTDGEDTSLISEAGLVNVKAMNKALYEQSKAAGLTAGQLAIMGVATGQFTQEQAAAALKAAILTEKIKSVAAQIVASGSLDMGEALAGLDTFRQQLDTGQITGAASSIDALAGAADGFAGTYAAEISVEDQAAMTAITQAQEALNMLAGTYYVNIVTTTSEGGTSTGETPTGGVSPTTGGGRSSAGVPVTRNYGNGFADSNRIAIRPEVSATTTQSGSSNLASGASGGAVYNVHVNNYIDGQAQGRSGVDDVTTDKLMAALRGLGVRS